MHDHHHVYQEEEDSEGRAKDQIVEIVGRGLLCEVEGGEKALGGREELPDDLATMAKVLKDTTNKSTRGVIEKKAHGTRDWRRRGWICRGVKKVNKSIRRGVDRGGEGLEQ